MKLYTEEQVKYMLGRARLHNQDDSEMFTDEYLLSEETSIKLPCDFDKELSYEYGFHDGAKWVAEQIKQQSNGN